MVSIFLLAGFTAIYILDHQNMRLPILDEQAWTLKAEFTSAQAVVPGKGQTIRGGRAAVPGQGRPIRVPGIRIGDVSRVRLHDGRALVDLSMDQNDLGL